MRITMLLENAVYFAMHILDCGGPHRRECAGGGCRFGAIGGNFVRLRLINEAIHNPAYFSSTSMQVVPYFLPLKLCHLFIAKMFAEQIAFHRGPRLHSEQPHANISIMSILISKCISIDLVPMIEDRVFHRYYGWQ